MLSHDDISEMVACIDYKPGWRITMAYDGARPYLQVHVSAKVGLCAESGGALEWKGGKHFLSMHMCRQEIVGACFGAFKAAEEHEMREWFKYRGVRIFNPHLDPDALVAFASDPANINERE